MGGVLGVFIIRGKLLMKNLESLPRGSAAGIPCILDNPLRPNYYMLHPKP